MTRLTPLEELISFRRKNILITGAGSGIGRAMAYRFAEAGASLQLVDINKKNLAQTKKELLKFGVAINNYTADLSQKKQIDALWRKMQIPDVLINNVGIYPFKDFLKADEAFLNKVMGVNLFSAFWMSQWMIKKKKKGGVIINVGSIEAFLPFADEMTVYNISKIGVIGLTRSLAKEYGGRGFRINALIPGGIVTPGTMSKAKQILNLKLGLIKLGVKYGMRVPAARAGEPDDVAKMAVVLASDLSGYTHGALIPVDGGFLSN